MVDKLEDIGATSLIAQLTSPHLFVEEMELLQSELRLPMKEPGILYCSRKKHASTGYTFS